jgi:hypothetical protein
MGLALTTGRFAGEPDAQGKPKGETLAPVGIAAIMVVERVRWIRAGGAEPR